MKKGILKAIIEDKGEEIKTMYAAGDSLGEISNKIIGRRHPGSIAKYLRSQGIVLRTRSEGNSVKANSEGFQDRRRAKLVGKPSWNKGKSYKQKKRGFRPHLRGAGNPQWKGGKTDLQRLVRSLPEYATWRFNVFQRDNFTCTLCGCKKCAGQKICIQCDHIYPFSKILDDYCIKTTDEALNCEALWDLNNGRTLCKECHKKTPTWGCNLNKKNKKLHD